MLLQSLLSDLQKLVSSSVVKFDHKAKDNETAESLRFSDIYISIMEGSDKFSSYPSFDTAAVINAGLDYFNPMEDLGQGFGITTSYEITIPIGGLPAGTYWISTNDNSYSFTIPNFINDTDRIVIAGDVDRYTRNVTWFAYYRAHDTANEDFIPYPAYIGTKDGTELKTKPSVIVDVTYSAAELATNKNLIPANKRSDVVAAQRIITKESYKTDGDLNNYYRMLSGFPDIGMPGLYLIDAEYSMIGIVDEDKKVPIHQLSSAAINRLIALGVIDIYKNKYPEYKYLDFIGDGKIDPLFARQSRPFSLLRTTSDVPSSLYDLFHKLYDQNRDYVMNVVYNRDLYTSYEMYDNFMGLVIMIMTIQRVISSTIKKAIQRDLYDWTFIKNLYASYNIPFIEDLSMDTHVLLTKNFNKLLQYKATDKVIFDICSLMGHPEISVEKYFLVKKQKYDSNGRPIIDESNRNNQYDLYFQAVDLDEDNVAIALQNKTNTLSYEEVTGDDPYWWDSGNLRNTILEKEFNFIESKYISLNIMYNMTDMLFNVAYAFRLVLDKKDDIEDNGLVISLPKITADKDFNLFNVMVFLIAVTSFSNGFTGNIPSPETISHIYGFNFDIPTVTLIKNLVDENRTKLSSSVVEYFDNIIITSPTMSESFTITNLDDVDKLFTNIKELRDILVDTMYTTQSTEEYYICKQIYDTILTTENVTSMFNVDGIQYTTYGSYIRANEPLLYQYIDPTSTEYTVSDRNTVIEHVLAQLEASIPSFDGLAASVTDINPIYNAIITLIKFFKSYTIDVHSFNIWYLMNDKYFNHIKMISKIGHIDSKLWTKSHINSLYFDQGYIESSISGNDTVMKKESYKLIYSD